jgi:PadR family transcriptional regulator PadR
MARRKPGTLFPIELEILNVGIQLQASQGSFYGFALARGLAADDGAGLTGHGTLYKALGRMADSGLLEAEWEDAEIAEQAGRPRRRLYRVTGEGQRIHSETIERHPLPTTGRAAAEGMRFA